MVKVIFICLGNICRSPMAQAIFEHQIKEAQFEDHFKAQSAGTAGYHIGAPPDPRTLSTLKSHGILFEHQAHRVNTTDIDTYDYLITMDHQNFVHLQNMNSVGSVLIKMRDFDPLEKNGDVPDPYYGQHDRFEGVFEILNRSIKGLILVLKEKHLS
jgi:protein-tyrosine phosphatase